MLISRRGFASAALGAAVAAQLPARALAQDARYAAALAAIRAYAEANLRHFGLPGLTLALSAPDGFNTVMNLGFANADARTPIISETLFQIGSISKLIAAAVVHQLAGEGRLKLTDRISELLPEVRLPNGNSVQVQHLLDHVAGLPADAPVFADGGLWTAYQPGEHWNYSNTGYDILGLLIERVSGAPLAKVERDRIFEPLGMRRTRGAIVASDRTLYAQGYEVADHEAFVPGARLAPAPWLDVSFAGGNVASTGEDMILLMRSIADAAQGRGGLGLPPETAKAFASHAVASDGPDMRYGNGLMHVANAGRSYLHHTGGMLSFSSAFHIDKSSGAAAFASTSLGGYAEFRPKLLSRFAADALTSAAAGAPLPPPPSLFVPSAHTPAYVGRYKGPAGEFEVSRGTPLTIVSNGKSATLHPIGGDLFRTLHPDFRTFTLLFQRRTGTVVGAAWGPALYLRAGATVQVPQSDAQLAKLAGRFGSDNPWFGPVRVVERGGRLWIGTEQPMTRIGDNLWRVGQDSWSPERASFHDFIDGRPQTLILSGQKYLRQDIEAAA
ncbi:MAG TPA: serine hydrolase domain-containing protein [Sphingomicrobium sp.]|jgi:CubicO group peptidase (beta-lactamase class C family)